jgi:tagatose-1,6-bisphosphate aldolase non-catalytic subunit AgaZ/GatZ
MSEKGEWVCNDVKDVKRALRLCDAGEMNETEYLAWRSQFIVGDPQPTPDGKEFTTEALKKMGMVGLYRKL